MLQKFAAGYHPFYITDDPEGGYEFKNAQERRKVSNHSLTTLQLELRFGCLLVWSKHGMAGRVQQPPAASVSGRRTPDSRPSCSHPSGRTSDLSVSTVKKVTAVIGGLIRWLQASRGSCSGRLTGTRRTLSTTSATHTGPQHRAQQADSNRRAIKWLHLSCSTRSLSDP